MKKNTIFTTFFAFFGVFFAFFASFSTNIIVFAEDDSSVYVVTANSAVVYEQPDFSSEKLSVLTHGDEVSLEMEEGSPKEYVYGEYIFFHCENGYIFSDLLTPKTSQIISIPNFNGKTNSNCYVYFSEDLQLVESDILLEKGQQIFLYEGYDSKTEYTAIAFLQDNDIMYGYIKTEYVNPNGVNPLLITCAVIILAVLGIIFAWLFMKRKKIKLGRSKTDEITLNKYENDDKNQSLN